MYTQAVKTKPKSSVVKWVIEGQLARGRRPGFEFNRGRQTPKSVVDAWIKEAKAQGIRSVICILDERKLRFYESLKMDLPAYYRSKGLQVVHVNAPNFRQPPLSDEHLIEAISAYQKLRKPVLVHCNAGIARTGMVVRYIKLFAPVL